jgi:RimJ/RimL family protein N-acetyltransferase
MSAWSAMPPELVTDRLLLGPWRPDDLDPFVAMVSERDPRAAAAPRDGRPTRKDLAERIQQRRRELQETGLALYAIRLEGTFVGYCGLTPGRASLDEPEIAYELLQRYHGAGYATEAAHAVVAAAAVTGRRRLWATVRTWNQSSFRVLTKVGFAADRITADEFGPLAWWTRTLGAEPDGPTRRH